MMVEGGKLQVIRRQMVEKLSTSAVAFCRYISKLHTIQLSRIFCLSSFIYGLVICKRIILCTAFIENLCHGEMFPIKAGQGSL